MTEKMQKQTVSIGRISCTSSGHQQDNTRAVEFIGEKLGQVIKFGEDRNGGLTDSRGTTLTLYKTEDDWLLVHTKEWSQWQGEPNDYSLQAVTPDDLGPNGRFEALGYEAGYGRPLTLDEALMD